MKPLKRRSRRTYLHSKHEAHLIKTEENTYFGNDIWTGVPTANKVKISSM